MTTFERLAIRLKKDCGCDLINFRRTYVGHWQRCSGAFVWIATVNRDIDKNTGYRDIGSIWPANELLKEKRPLLLLKGYSQSDGEIIINT